MNEKTMFLGRSYTLVRVRNIMSFAHELEDLFIAGFNPEKDSETARSNHQVGKFV
jgi:hypothetical protein